MKKESPSYLNIEINEESESLKFLEDFFKFPNKIVDKEYMHQVLYKNNLISKEQLENKTNYTAISTVTDSFNGYCNISYADEANFTINANSFYFFIEKVKEKNSFFNNSRIEFEINKNDYYMFDISRKKAFESNDNDENIFVTDVLSGNLSNDTFEMISCINDYKFTEQKIQQSIKEYDLFVKKIVASILSPTISKKLKNK